MSALARAVVLALAVFAYWPLAQEALQTPTAHQFESWMFRPSQLPLALVIAVAGWLVWRRCQRLGAGSAPARRAETAVLLAAGALSYGWAVLTRTPDWLLVSLAANLLAFASAAGAGAGALLLPALALLFGLRIPAPLRNEIVWGLQRATAFASGHVLAPLRDDFTREGVILRAGEHSFHVIDGCSGLQGIAILTFVALIVGELHQLSRRRRLLLAAVAPPLGYALNVVRIAYIAASPNPEAYAGLHGDHTPQGLAVLAAGTALLYALGRVRVEPDRPARDAPHALRSASWWPAAAALAALSLASVALPPFPPRNGIFEPSEVRFPDQRAGWTSEPIVGDPYFVGPQPAGQLLYRRYAHGSDAQLIDVVDVLIGMDGEDLVDASALLSTKLRWPGPEWNLDRQRRARLWPLERDADFAVGAHASRPERAVIYAFRIRDGGLARESLRALFALETSPFRRERKRVGVRLVAFAPFDEPLAIDRAKQRLDRFLGAFRDAFSAL
jgi:exosortase